MVTRTNHSGFTDWLVQRVTAVLIGIYTLFIIIYLLANQPVDYFSWQALFNHLIMKIATMIVLLSILWHAWIGLWTVFTDYIKNKATRIVLEILVCILLVAYLFWGFEILWR